MDVPDTFLLKQFLKSINQAGDAVDEFTSVITHQSVWIAYQLDILLPKSGVWLLAGERIIKLASFREFSSPGSV
jgi:hypothetical protein